MYLFIYVNKRLCIAFPMELLIPEGLDRGYRDKGAGRGVGVEGTGRLGWNFFYRNFTENGP